MSQTVCNHYVIDADVISMVYFMSAGIISY